MSHILTNIKTYDQFQDVRWKKEYQVFWEVKRDLESGEISLQSPLGCLLAFLNFDNITMRSIACDLELQAAYNREQATSLIADDWDEPCPGANNDLDGIQVPFDYEVGYYFRDYLRKLVDRFDVDPNQPAAFIQGISKESLTTLIHDWVNAQENKPLWNPPYAPIQPVSDKVIEFCKRSTLEETIDGLSHSVMDRCSYLIFPFKGWTVAECLRISYES